MVELGSLRGILAMTRLTVVAAVSVALFSCKPRVPSPHDVAVLSAQPCDTATMHATPFDSTRWTQLEGLFEMVMVTTSYKDASAPHRYRLRLARTDSARRFYRRTGLRGPYGPVRDRPLMGQAEAQVSDSVQWRVSAEFEYGTLYIGCRECMDASPTHYRVSRVWPHGFAGTWRDYQTGIYRVVDSSGKALPDPAGYFCAHRVDDSAPRIR